MSLSNELAYDLVYELPCLLACLEEGEFSGAAFSTDLRSKGNEEGFGEMSSFVKFGEAAV